MTGDTSGKAKAILRAEMQRRGIGYEDLARRLTAAGAPYTPDNLRKKLFRGGFSAEFFLQCLEAMGATEVRLG